jgi:LytS/YehU family sensor histidine kinase
MFNAIGSVSNLMQSGRVDEAQDSLRKFSRLMRSTLEQSQGDDILLEDEIDFLENYLHLEKLILGDNFSFTITVDDSIDVAYERIPSLILQPIVENALKHGLRTKQGERKLNISFTLEEGSEQTTMQILIDDNGIGRKASAELNKDRKQHQSFATKSIDERIKIINTTAEFEKITLSFIDKIDAEGGATGTSVLINILS